MSLGSSSSALAAFSNRFPFILDRTYDASDGRMNPVIAPSSAAIAWFIRQRWQNESRHRSEQRCNSLVHRTGGLPFRCQLYAGWEMEYPTVSAQHSLRPTGAALGNWADGPPFDVSRPNHGCASVGGEGLPISGLERAESRNCRGPGQNLGEPLQIGRAHV